MSVSVSRESISKLMTELVDSFPMEAEGRSSISDFGKLLFAEGNASGANASENGAAQVKKEATIEEGDENEENDEDEEDDDDNDEDEEGVDDEMTPAPAAAGTKRVFTEIKGVPRQKHHDVQCVVTDSGKIAISHGSMNKLMKSKEKAVPKRWTTEEDERLRQAVAKHGERNWKSIAEEVPGRNHTQCLQRWTKVLAPGLVKGHWRPDEDELLKELVAEGRKNWGQVANRIPGRTSKQCRERWYNHLDPSIVRGEYTAEEDRIILEAQSRLGNKWSTIAAMLPGRTEDAVKIRWKSLCRVRKGQNRRSGAQAQPGDKVKGPNGKPVVPSAFNGNLVKSEELRAFTAIPTQATPMGRVPLVQPQMMGHAGMPMGSVPTMVAYAPPGSYPAAMGGYAKTVVMTPVNSYGQAMAPVLAVPTSEAFNLDRRANVVNISSPSSGAYRQVYAASSAQYGVDANGNVYSHGGVPTYMTSSGAPMYRVQGGAPAMMATHMHSQMGPSTGMSYGYSMHGMPPTPSSGEYGAPPQYNQSMNPGEAYAAAAHYNHQQQHQQQHASHEASQDRQQESSQSATPVPNPAANFAKSMSQPSSNKPASQPPSLAAAFAQSLGNTPKAASASPASMFAQNLSNKSANPPSAVSPAAAFAQKAAAAAAAAKSSTPTSNPAAMFAQNLATKAPTPSNGHQNKPSPVAAFLQKQNSENSGGNSPKRANSSSSTGPVPFNPAAAFAQRLQKPPMPSSSSSVKSTDEDEGMSEDGDEPSLKKVKPRNSIDMAARASAARRMRNSGTGNSLMGRRSLDVFLNEIGDVGRISDLKMDEFQTMDELWRVSGDMDRLSL